MVWVELVGVRYEAPIIPSGASGRMTLAEVVMGARALARYPEGRLLAALGAVQTFTRGCLSVLVLVLAIDLLDGGDAEVGILSAAVGAGAIGGVVGIAAMTGRRGLATLLGIGVVLWAVPLAVMGAAPRMVVVLIGMVVIGIGDALVDVGLFTLPARLVPDEVLARWFGALESVIAVSVAVGALVVTPLIAGLGARWTLVAVGLLGPACVLASWRGLRRIDAKVHVRDDAIDALRSVAMLRPLPMPAIEALAARWSVRRCRPGKRCSSRVTTVIAST